MTSLSLQKGALYIFEMNIDLQNLITAFVESLHGFFCNKISLLKVNPILLFCNRGYFWNFLTRYHAVQHIRVQVCTIGPEDSSPFGVDFHLGKNSFVF